VERALQQVPEPYRTALILRDLEEMSYEEIADVLSISLGTVKSRITRGRDALRRKLAVYAREVASELGLLAPVLDDRAGREAKSKQGTLSGGRTLGKTAREDPRSGTELEATP